MLANKKKKSPLCRFIKKFKWTQTVKTTYHFQAFIAVEQNTPNPSGLRLHVSINHLMSLWLDWAQLDGPN